MTKVAARPDYLEKGRRPVVPSRWAVIALVALASVPQARSAEWSFEPSASARLSYNDNITLTPGLTDSVWGYQASPKAVFAWREALTEITGEGRVGLNRYPGRGDLDTTDLLAQVRMSTASERDAYGLNAGVNRDSTLGSEVRKTGVVQTRRQRTQKTLAPSYRRTLSERASASLQYQYTDVGYQQGTGLQDYVEHSTTAGYAYSWSERLKTDTSVSWDALHTDDRLVRSDTKSINVGAAYSLSEQTTFGLSLGWRRTKTTLGQNALRCTLIIQIQCTPVTLSSTTVGNGLILGGNVDFDGNTGRYSFSLSRGLNPTGSGLTVRTDRVGFQWRRDWTEKLASTVSTAWLKSVYDGNLGAGSKYTTFDPALSYKLSEALTLSAAYGYVRTRTDNTLGVARSNSFFLTLEYVWPPISMK